MPVPGKRLMNTDQFQQIESPPVIKLAGRPRIKRFYSNNEPNPISHLGNLSKKGLKQQCGICKGEGHNRISCPNKGNQVRKKAICFGVVIFGQLDWIWKCFGHESNPSQDRGAKIQLLQLKYHSPNSRAKVKLPQVHSHNQISKAKLHMHKLHYQEWHIKKAKQVM